MFLVTRLRHRGIPDYPKTFKRVFFRYHYRCTCVKDQEARSYMQPDLCVCAHKCTQLCPTLCSPMFPRDLPVVQFCLSHCLLSVCCVTSAMSDFVRSHGLQPARLLCPWGFSRQEYWSGLPCPSPGYLPDPGIEPRFPALQAVSSPSEPPGKPVASFCTKCIVAFISGISDCMPPRPFHFYFLFN